MLLINGDLSIKWLLRDLTFFYSLPLVFNVFAFVCAKFAEEKKKKKMKDST